MKSLTQIKLLALDVDGVLTDGTIYYSPMGESVKGFSVRDGMGISLARLGGLQTAIITGRRSPMVEQRAVDLHIDYVMQGVKNKLAEMRTLCETMHITLEEAAYMGDDLNDAELIGHAGLGAAPCDACEEARLAAAFVSSREGGRGALREFVEYILKGQNKWAYIQQQYKFGRVDITQ